MYEARSIAVCCWHASAPVNRSRFTCNANKYLQFTAKQTKPSPLVCVYWLSINCSALVTILTINIILTINVRQINNFSWKSQSRQTNRLTLWTHLPAVLGLVYKTSQEIWNVPHCLEPALRWVSHGQASTEHKPTLNTIHTLFPLQCKLNNDNIFQL